MSILNSIDADFDRAPAMKAITHIRKVRLVFPNESLYSRSCQKMACAVFLAEHRKLKFKANDKGKLDV
jgi:hypothetical protein